MKQLKYFILVLIAINLYCNQLIAQKSTKKPLNIVLIFMDDLGYGDLSSFGHPTIQTPNIDRLAREGQKWTNFYAASSVCSPSRGALLTGRYPIRIGLAGENQRVFFPESIGGLPSKEITIAELLKKNGYKTGIVGKWHLGHLPEFLPTNQGFDEYYGIPYSNDMDAIKWSVEELLAKGDINKWNVPLMENETIIERPANQETITKRYTEKALDFIQKNKDNPFFLYLPHSMVHTPLFVSEEFKNKSPRGLFGDVMAEIDWSVGQVIEKLEKLELDKNTLVIFTSDNGPWLMMKNHGGSAGLLKDGKGTTWEGGMRVPAIFYMPGTIKAKTVHNMGATLDILPTVAAMTNTKLPKKLILDGYDLTEILKGGSENIRDHFFYYRKKEIYAVRKDSYKAHFITESCYVNNPERTVHKVPLLFNINEDPSERYNCSEKNDSIINQLVALTKKHQETVTIIPSELDKYPVKEK
ncbi:MAG: arylsulfatase [Cryomorphaceae bacterium BACL22 MAG-120619-bin32]|jgi:arylsulfatase A|nr:MAG: arylsulfatase [Cryomorphaceae bacterium BACL22 MAG-120619-bin32]